MKSRDLARALKKSRRELLGRRRGRPERSPKQAVTGGLTKSPPSRSGSARRRLRGASAGTRCTPCRTVLERRRRLGGAACAARAVGIDGQQLAPSEHTRHANCAPGTPRRCTRRRDGDRRPRQFRRARSDHRAASPPRRCSGSTRSPSTTMPPPGVPTGRSASAPYFFTVAPQVLDVLDRILHVPARRRKVVVGGVAVQRRDDRRLEEHVHFRQEAAAWVGRKRCDEPLVAEAVGIDEKAAVQFSGMMIRAWAPLMSGVSTVFH